MNNNKRVSTSIIALLLTILLITCLTGCSKPQPLPDEMDEDTVTAMAKDAIDRANARAYEELVALFRQDLQETTISISEWADALNPILDDAGDFIEYTGSSALGQTQDGVESGIVVVQAKYKNKTLIYTIAFDIDSNMTGFWVR